jgi:hypothetical protein
MFRYYITTKDRARLASRLAHGLSRPAGVPETETDITEYQFQWLTKPDDPNLACAVVSVEDNVFVHQYIRDSINNNNGITSYFNDFYLTVQEANEKKQIVANSYDNDGGLIVNIPILSILPNDWQEVTEPYLRDNGWFSKEI